MAKRGRPTNEERAERAADAAEALTREQIVADAESFGSDEETIDVSAAISSDEDEAVAGLGLSPEHVASRRVDGASVVIVTKGGVKLRWPQDIARAKALTQSQKDGQFPGGVNPNSKAWHEPPEKNASLVNVFEKKQKEGK